MGSRPRKIGRKEAAVLLSGGRSNADRDSLSDLLAAAGRSPQHETRDRELVLAAFVRAPYEDAPNSDIAERQRGRRPARFWAWTVRVGAVLAVVLIGMTAAARVGVLPAPFQNAAHDLLSGAGVPPAPHQQDHDRSGDPRNPEEPVPASQTRGAELADDSDEARDLCRGVLEADRDGHPADQADLAALARLAGGEARVGKFCDEELGGEPTSSSGEEIPGAAPSPTPTADGSAGDDRPGSANGGSG